jgi:hypothetical protein
MVGHAQPGHALHGLRSDELILNRKDATLDFIVLICTAGRND